MAAVGRTNPFLLYYCLFFVYQFPSPTSSYPLVPTYIYLPFLSLSHLSFIDFIPTYFIHGLEITLKFIDFRYQYQVFFVFTCCMIYLIIKTLTMFSINSYSRFSIAQKESVLKIQNVSIYFPAASTLIVCKDSCEFLN